MISFGRKNTGITALYHLLLFIKDSVLLYSNKYILVHGSTSKINFCASKKYFFLCKICCRAWKKYFSLRKLY